MKFFIWHKFIYLIFITLSIILFFVYTGYGLFLVFFKKVYGGVGLSILFGLITFSISLRCFSYNHSFLKNILSHRINADEFVVELFYTLMRILFCYGLIRMFFLKLNVSTLMFSPIALGFWLPVALFLWSTKIPLVLACSAFVLESVFIVQITWLKLSRASIEFTDKERSKLESALSKLLEIRRYPFNRFVAGEKSLKEILMGSSNGKKD